MQGTFEEVALELVAKDGSRKPVIGNALERQDDSGVTQFIRLSFIPAADRKKYEQDLRDARAHAVKGLSEEQQTSGLREQFIAVLGHDLRNPLASLDSAFRLLSNEIVDDRSTQIVGLARASIARMAGLIDNVMDFARGRLGGGIPIEMREADIEPVVLQVVDELRIANPTRVIVSDIDLPDPVNCDPGRLGQVVSNLLANALVHGDQAGVVRLHASQSTGRFTLWVANNGVPIPTEVRGSLFEPFHREQAAGSQHGLGLGLYISSEIVKEHGGVLSVTSDEIETRFTLSLPASR
jgi:sigma-B regulation protein RsbU (phosphoserine phosphatase)